MSEDGTVVILREIARLGSDLHTGMAKLGADLREQMGKLDADLREQMARLERRVERLEGRFDQFRAELNRVRSDVMDRIDRLRDRMEIVRDDMSVSLHSDERVERLARSASEEARSVGSLVTAMQKQILNLQTEVRALRGGAV